jgi:hypothetical protein
MMVKTIILRKGAYYGPKDSDDGLFVADGDIPPGEDGEQFPVMA